MDKILEYILTHAPAAWAVAIALVAGTAWLRSPDGEEKRKLLVDPWVIGAAITAFLGLALYYTVPRFLETRPAFKPGVNGVVLFPLEGDTDGAASRYLRGMLAQNRPGTKVVVRKRAVPIDRLSAKVVHDRAGLAVSGIVVGPNRLKLHLARADGALRTVPLDLSRHEQAWSRIKAHWTCPSAGDWHVLFLHLDPSVAASKTANVDAGRLQETLIQLGVNKGKIKR